MSEKQFEPTPEKPFPYGEKIEQVPLDRIKPGDIIQANALRSDGIILFAVLDVHVRSGTPVYVTVRVGIKSTGEHAFLNGLTGELRGQRIEIDGFHLFDIRNVDGTQAKMGNPYASGNPFSLGRIFKSFQVIQNMDKAQ